MTTRRTRQAAAALAALLALAAAACSSGHSSTGDAAKAVRSAARAAHSAAASSSPSPSSSPAEITSGGQLIWPPFGKNAVVEISSYLPSDPSLRQAVLAVKDFLLAILYSDYVGGQDQRWQQYIGSQAVLQQLDQVNSQPEVTTESWTGTVVLWGMEANINQGTAFVSECFDTAGSLNTSLTTGAVLPASEQFTTDEHYSYESDELEMQGGQWKVTDIPPAIYYPAASFCKPS
jgi:hypothetical protein